MTNQEIITKAIDLAIAGGWKITDNRFSSDMNVDNVMEWFEYPFYIIFNHDFTKALWGKEDEHLSVEEINPEIGGHYDQQEQPPIPSWQKHLMTMVIADDPIQYLGEHLPK